MIGRPELVNDDRFKDDLARGEQRRALSAHMGEWCADRTTDECLGQMERHKVPGGPVLDAPAGARPAPRAADRRVRARSSTRRRPSRCPWPASRSCMSAHARRRSAAGRRSWASTPTRSCELGYDDDEIDRLRAAVPLNVRFTADARDDPLRGGRARRHR